MSKPDSWLEKGLERAVFGSRWLQAPLYLGLIVAQSIYVYQFFVELWHLICVACHGVGGAGQVANGVDTATTIMLGVLGLIDVVMIANLLVMVIIGGYETFVSRLDLDDHDDQPEWLSHVNAGALKVKLATALISISSIHLLKTFIELRGEVTIHSVVTQTGVPTTSILWQVIIHVVFVFSAVVLAWADRLSAHSKSSPKGVLTH